jgi:hypothetical protein
LHWCPAHRSPRAGVGSVWPDNLHARSHILGNARGKVLNIYPDAPVDMPGFADLNPRHQLQAMAVFGLDVESADHMADVAEEFPALDGASPTAAPLDSGAFPPLTETEKQHFGLSKRQISMLGPEGRKINLWELESSKPAGASVEQPKPKKAVAAVPSLRRAAEAEGTTAKVAKEPKTKVTAEKAKKKSKKERKFFLQPTKPKIQKTKKRPTKIADIVL